MWVYFILKFHPKSEEWVQEKVINRHSHIRYIHVHIYHVYPMRPK